MRQTTTSQPPEPATSQGPSRFQVLGIEQEPPTVLRRVGYLAAILALVVGVPAVLLVLAGPPPIPTSIPGRDDLAASISMEQVLTVLVAVVWLAWLQFVTCLIVELFATVSRRGVPSPVPFSGPSQRLARILVGGLLLAGVLGGQVASVVSALDVDSVRSAATISDTVGESDATASNSSATSNASLATAMGEVGTTSAGLGSEVAPSADPSSTVGRKVYTVKPPVGHHYESLWEIAERHLGDGRRYKEVFALNETVLQADGGVLHLARLIQPGWQLIMPEDAVGVARLVPPAQRVEPPATVAPRAPSATDPEPVTAGSDGATALEGRHSAAGPAGGSQVDHQVTGQFAQQAVPANPIVAGLATSGLFGACVLSALLMRRARTRGGVQPGEDALDAEVGLHVGADLDRARWLDSALRTLASTCAETGHQLPPVYAALVDDDELELLLAPARTSAPHPWAVSDQGRRWVLKRKESARAPAAGPAAYPALVCLGRDEQGRDVLVDLEASGGPVQITGDAVLASQVASALAIQLATMPWSDAVQVSALGLPGEVTALAGGRIEAITDLGPVVSRLEARGAHGQDDVLTGRLSGGRDQTPEYLVLVEPITGELMGRVGAVTSGSRHPFGVVAVGAIPGAQWRLEVDEAGSLTLPILGLSVTAHRLLPASLKAVADLFEAADTEPPALASGRVAIPGTGQGIDDGTFAAAQSRVGILGPVEVRATGPMDPSRVPLAQEVVTYLAAHPDGVHPGVLAAAIWPRGVTHAVSMATMDRIRDWLGDEPDGAARLRTDESGRYLLAPSVAIDWHSFCTLLQRSRSASSPAAEAELLRRALRLVRGPVLADRPSARYSWLVREPLERTIEAVVVDAAHRLAEISGDVSDPADCAAASLAGLRLTPTAQLLWRDLLAAEHRGGGVPALEAAVADMQETMDRYGVPVDAETEALIEHLGGSGPSAGRATGTATGS